MARKTEEWIGKSDDTFPPPRVKLRLITKWDGRCADCGCKLGPASPAQFDHITPLRDGGENREGNLQPLCRPCHARKTGSEAHQRAKTDRLKAKHHGITKRSFMPGSRASKWKRRMDGTVVRRDDGDRD